MGRLKKTLYEETRVMVSISYDMNHKKYNDDILLDLVKDTDNFSAVEQQMYGCGMIPNGFIIFQGVTIPTAEDKKQMVDAVNAAFDIIKSYRKI